MWNIFENEYAIYDMEVNIDFYLKIRVFYG